MKGTLSLLAITLVGMMATASTAAGNGPDSGLLGWWGFDEGAGVYSASAIAPVDEAELHNVSWVKGEFGTALRLTGSDSYVTLPSMPKLDGSDEMSLAVWVYWEGTGRYLQLDGLEYGGKTGTADMDPLYTKIDYLASFEAFAPADDPRFVILVMMEKPRAGRYYGGVVAGPVVGRVLARVFNVSPKADSIVMRY